MNNGPKVGDIVPAFTLNTDGNGRISSRELKGAPAVIYFYPKDDTSGCTKEAIDFSTLKPEFDRLRTRIIGISADSVQRHDRFKDKHDLTVTLASDEEHAALEAFGVWVEKSMYGRRFMGIERATFLVGADGRIAEVWRKVKVPGHAEAVLEAARSLER